jgi:hypothetical protein
MSAKSLFATFTGFLSHHVNDLVNVAAGLSSVANALPIDPQDKERVNSVIDVLSTSAQNINDFLTHAADHPPADVVIKESDLVKAVANYLASTEGKKVLADAAKGNANG